MMDAVTCKLFASLCLWTYIFIECSNGVPFHGFLTSADKFSRDIGEEEMGENEQRIREEDLRKLILKKLRFRDLEDVSYPREYDELSKLYDLSPLDTSEKEQKRSSNINSAFADKVAALLNGLKTRQIDSPKVRMSSLRFGR
ncbi:uncharacterized protein [Mytilus edulis]|uniref:uncharacterized protein n=1 Tax=Mytilus edulis TaxID=6550 RepID=UPI0039EED78A